MSQTKELISVLSPTECQNFIKHLIKRNKRHDTRNVDLFKAHIANKEDAIKKTIGSNAYNVLNKRLSDRLVDFMAQHSFDVEATAEISVIKQILVSRKLLAHNRYKLAFKILSSAENQSILINDYTLLNEIYHTLIQYSYHSDCPDQKEIFIKFENNQRDFLAQERINMVYAVIRKAFNDNEYNSESIDLENLFADTYAKFGITKEQAYNFKTLYQLAEIADIKGTYRKNYHHVSLFFIDKINEIKDSSMDTEKHLIYHIDLLYLIANIYFRKKEFTKSLTFLDSMYQQMLRYNNRFYNERKIRYSTLLALVYNYSKEHQKAMGVITGLVDSSIYKQEELSNPLLVKLMIHFQQGELIDANKVLIKLNKSDKWYQKQIGTEWLLNKKYLEILLHIELGNTDYADSRILSLTRSYGSYFKSTKEFQVLPFLKLVKSYYHNPTLVNTLDFKRKVEKSLKWKATYEEDLFLMSFYAWLKAKMENKAIYQTTLELIDQTN